MPGDWLDVFTRCEGDLISPVIKGVSVQWVMNIHDSVCVIDM